MADSGRIKRSKIAIVGYTEHKQRAPWANPAWEIWSLNDHHLDLANVNIPEQNERLRWFQLHDWNEAVRQHDYPDGVLNPQTSPESPRDPHGHVAWLQSAAKEIPVYMLEPREEVPDAVLLPLAEMNAYFDRYFTRGLRYWTNSISYMIGYAIMQLAPNYEAVEGAEIGVWGVDMMVAGGLGSEYGYQRPSCEVFLGIAAGLGITVTLPEESDLLLAAFDYGSSLKTNRYRTRLLAHRRELSARRGSVDQQLAQLQAARAELSGAISALDWTLGAHMPGDPGEGADGKVYVPDSHKRDARLIVAGAPVEVNEHG